MTKYFISGIVIFLILSCSKVDSTFTLIAYPKNADPFGKNWKYRVRTLVLSEDVRCNELGYKKVTIDIQDFNRNYLLQDVYYFNAASIRSDITWNVDSLMVLELYEVGSSNADDNYNKHLIGNGPKLLKRLYYHYDHRTHTFLLE